MINAIFKDKREEFAYLLPCVLETLWKRDTEKTENYLPPGCVRAYFERLPNRIASTHKIAIGIMRENFQGSAQIVFGHFEEQATTKKFTMDITKLIVAKKLQEEAMQLNDSIYVEFFERLQSGRANSGVIVAFIRKLDDFVARNEGAFGFVDKIKGPAPDVHLFLQSALGADLTTVRESEGDSFKEMAKTAIKGCQRLEPQPGLQIGNILAAFQKFEELPGPSAGSAPEESPDTGAELAARNDVSRRERIRLDLPSDDDIELTKQQTPFKDKVSRAVWRTFRTILEEASHFSSMFEIGIGSKVEKPAQGRLTPFCALFTILNSSLRPETFNVNGYYTDFEKCARHGANVFEITREDTTEANTEQAEKLKSLIESFSDFLDEATEEIKDTEGLMFACTAAKMFNIVCFETESGAKVVDQTEAVNLIGAELARERHVLLQLMAESRVRLEDDQEARPPIALHAQIEDLARERRRLSQLVADSRVRLEDDQKGEDEEEESPTVPRAQIRQVIDAGVATDETKVDADPGTYTPTFALLWIRQKGTERLDLSLNKFTRAKKQERVDFPEFKLLVVKEKLDAAVDFCSVNEFDLQEKYTEATKANNLTVVLGKTRLTSTSGPVEVESKAVEMIEIEVNALIGELRLGFGTANRKKFNEAIHAQMQETKQFAHESGEDSAEDSAGVEIEDTRPKLKRGSFTETFISGLSTVKSGIFGAAGKAATAVLDTLADASAPEYVSEVKSQVFPDTSKLTPESALFLILTNSARPPSFNTDSFAGDLQMCKDEDYRSNKFTVVSAAEPKDLDTQAKLQARLQALIAKLKRVEPQNYDGATQNEKFVVTTLSILKRIQIIPEREEFAGKSVKLNPSTMQLLEKEVDRQIRVVGKLVVPEGTTKGKPGFEQTASNRYSLRSSANSASAEVTGSDVNPDEGMITPGFALGKIAAVPQLKFFVGDSFFVGLTSRYGSALNVFETTNAGKTTRKEHDTNVKELENIEAKSAFFFLVFRKIKKNVLDDKLQTITSQGLKVLKRIIEILKTVQCIPDIEEKTEIKPQTEEITFIKNVCKLVMNAILAFFDESIGRAYYETETPEEIAADGQVKIVSAAVLEALARVQQTASSKPEEVPAGAKGGGAGGPGAQPKVPVEVPTGEKGAASTRSTRRVAGGGAGGPGARPQSPEPSSAAPQTVMKIGAGKQLKPESCALGNWLITERVAREFQLEKFVNGLQTWCSEPGFVKPKGGNSPNDSVSFLVQLLCEPRTLDRLIKERGDCKFAIASSGGNKLSDTEACFFGLSKFASADSNFAKDAHDKFTQWVKSHTTDESRDVDRWFVSRPAFALLTLIGIFMTAFSSGERNNVLVIGESEVELFMGTKITYPESFSALLLIVMDPWFPVPISE